MRLLLLLAVLQSSAAISTKKCVTHGCGAEICAEEGEEIASPCVYNPATQCLKFSKCKRLKDGKCGWVHSKKTLDCQKKASN